MWANPQETVDVVTFTEEIRNRKLDFLCSDSWKNRSLWNVISKVMYVTYNVKIELFLFSYT